MQHLTYPSILLINNTQSLDLSKFSEIPMCQLKVPDFPILGKFLPVLRNFGEASIRNFVEMVPELGDHLNLETFLWKNQSWESFW